MADQTARRFRSKPSEVEAVQWTGFNFEALYEFVHPGWETDHEDAYVIFDHDEGLTLLAGKFGAQGLVEVPVGHWIVRQTNDLTDHWPVDPDYFAAKYEEAPDA